MIFSIFDQNQNLSFHRAGLERDENVFQWWPLFWFRHTEHNLMTVKCIMVFAECRERVNALDSLYLTQSWWKQAMLQPNTENRRQLNFQLSFLIYVSISGCLLNFTFIYWQNLQIIGLVLPFWHLKTWMPESQQPCAWDRCITLNSQQRVTVTHSVAIVIDIAIDSVFIWEDKRVTWFVLVNPPALSSWK